MVVLKCGDDGFLGSTEDAGAAGWGRKVDE